MNNQQSQGMSLKSLAVIVVAIVGVVIVGITVEHKVNDSHNANIASKSQSASLSESQMQQVEQKIADDAIGRAVAALNRQGNTNPTSSEVVKYINDHDVFENQ